MNIACEQAMLRPLQRAFNLDLDYSNSLTLSNVREQYPSLERERKVGRHLFNTSYMNSEIRPIFTSLSCNDGKEMYNEALRESCWFAY